MKGNKMGRKRSMRGTKILVSVGRKEGRKSGRGKKAGTTTVIVMPAVAPGFICGRVMPPPLARGRAGGWAGGRSVGATLPPPPLPNLGVVDVIPKPSAIAGREGMRRGTHRPFRSGAEPPRCLPAC